MHNLGQAGMGVVQIKIQHKYYIYNYITNIKINNNFLIFNTLYTLHHEIRTHVCGVKIVIFGKKEERMKVLTIYLPMHRC